MSRQAAIQPKDAQPPAPIMSSLASIPAFGDVTGGIATPTWEALAHNRLYSSRDWLRFCSTDIGGDTATGAVHVTREGDVVAAASVTAIADEPNSFYQWHGQLIASGLPAPDPAGILMGQRRGYQTHLLTREGVSAESVAPALLGAMRQLQRDVTDARVLPSPGPGPVPCVACFLTTPDVLALMSAGVSTLPVLMATDAWIAVPQGGWAQWLASLPSKGRRDSVKQEVKAFDGAGYAISRHALSDCYQEAAQLLAGTQKRHGQPYDITVLTESFRRQAAAMGPAAQVLLCAREGEPATGFCLFYTHGDALYLRAVGFDYERLQRGAAEYFNLTYYEPVRIAAQHGLRWLHPGIESPEVKALRGASLRPLWLLDLADDSVLSGHDEVIRAHNATQLERLKQSSPAVAKGLELDLYDPFCSSSTNRRRTPVSIESSAAPATHDQPDQAVLFMGDLVVLARQGRLISEARRRGYVPIAVVSTGTDLDRLAATRTDATHFLADLAEVVQVQDAAIATVMPAVQPLLQRYDVRGVISVGEVFVEPVGVLADCLGLPGAGSAAAVICRNKLLQRIAAPKFSPRVHAVPHDQRSTFALAAEDFPAVVKPAGRFYSSGVVQVAEQTELTAALKHYAPAEIVLVESRVVGREFSVEALVQHGEVLWAAVTGKETNEHEGRYFTETSHTCPALIGAEENSALLAANAEVLRLVGVRDGITHAEYRLTDNGVVLMEVAARLPGDAITFLWELATGEPVEPVMLDLALGVPAAYPAPRRRARQHFLDHPHGVLQDVTADGVTVAWPTRDDRWPELRPLAADAPPLPRAVLVTRVPGDMLGPQLDSGHRSACVIVDAPLDSDLDPVTREAADLVEMVVTAA